MNFSQDTTEESTFIHSYTSEYLVINQSKFDCHCLVHRDGMIKCWSPENTDDFVITDFDEIIACRPDVVLLGTGQQLRFPSNDIRRYFLQQQIGLEVMDTGAACRTYNILLAEGRNVAAAILLNKDF